MAGGERGAVEVTVVRAGAAYLEADQVHAGDARLMVLGEVGDVVSGAAAQLQDVLAAQVVTEDLGVGAEARVGAPFHPGRCGERMGGGSGHALGCVVRRRRGEFPHHQVRGQGGPGVPAREAAAARADAREIGLAHQSLDALAAHVHAPHA